MHYIFELTNVNKLTVSILPHQLISPILLFFKRKKKRERRNNELIIKLDRTQMQEDER